MLQIFETALAQVISGNTLEKQVIYFLYQAKEITKKVYNKRMNSIKL